jgi:hypothetical protein
VQSLALQRQRAIQNALLASGNVKAERLFSTTIIEKPLPDIAGNQMLACALTIQ